MPSNLKKLVRAEMARSGDSYQGALRKIRAQECDHDFMRVSHTLLVCSKCDKHATPPGYNVCVTGISA
jgi:hypothetical protein